MTIVVCVDEIYWHKSQILFESLKKNWKGRVCTLCVDFRMPDDEILKFEENFDFAWCKKEAFKSYREGWPSNRPLFFCCESGEFLNYFDFDDEELIIHLDADMIMQREMNEIELHQLDHIEQGEIAACASAYPTMSLREELFRLLPRRGYETINNDYPGILGDIPLYCSGLTIARANTYERMRGNYIQEIDKMIANFDHHAASQWLFNYLTWKYFNVIKLNSVFSNAKWYIDTKAEERDGQLITNGQVVLFNHTKFEKEYKY